MLEGHCRGQQYTALHSTTDLRLKGRLMKTPRRGTAVGAPVKARDADLGGSAGAHRKVTYWLGGEPVGANNGLFRIDAESRPDQGGTGTPAGL